MALSLQLLLLSLIFLITSSSAIVLPVTRDLSTLQYVTSIYHGTPRGPTRLVVDLGGPFLWVDCASGHVSSSHKPIPSGSLRCLRAKASNWCGNSKSCGLNIFNAITRVTARGELAEGIVGVDHVDQLNQIGSIVTVDDFLFFCVPKLLLNGLASGAKGMMGLGRASISLPSLLAKKFGFHRKFAICLSSSEGVILSGDRPYVSLRGPDVSNSLMYTPLISNQDGTLEDYYIQVKSIKINGKRLSLNTSMLTLDRQGNGGTKLSTIAPYTTMESTIYETFTRAYTTVATSMNMTRVASVGPFGLCFSSGSIEKTPVVVPAIDLVLQSEMVKWRIHGRNSMVSVSDEVMCLGFLDGGLSPGASIVLGGHQLEDHLLEFNMGTSMLGFKGTSCSDFKLYSIPSE